MSGWADNYIKKLLLGGVDGTVSFRFVPRGDSMVPLIKSGQLVTLTLATKGTVKVGDIVLCKVGRATYLHLVRAIDPAKDRYQIGNIRGKINGWTQGSHIYGKVIKIED